ncbi:MAG: DUF4252 domain-containing protein [Bacteroidetes bacterium]|nr:DUF4252 domain-containing protein [Bacteroidota bacterium]MCH8942910.1 DUF4252 domain-containing protein [Bacteroidota bacterium]
MKYFKRISLLAIFLFALTVNAQDDKDYINEPGYVDFGTLTSFYKGDEVTEVFLDEHLLKMMSKLSGENDSEMKILLRGLKLVKVYSFKVPKDSRLKVRSKIGDIDKKLLKEKWYRIIKIKEKNKYTNVYLKPSNDENNIVGLAVVSLDDDGEASFINIVGNINLDNLGRLSDKFNIPMMFNKHHKKNKKKVVEEKKN